MDCDALLDYAVRSVAGWIPAGFYGQAHLLAEGAAEEAANAMVLPLSGLSDLRQGCTVGAAKEFQDGGFLRSGARLG